MRNEWKKYKLIKNKKNWKLMKRIKDKENI